MKDIMISVVFPIILLIIMVIYTVKRTNRIATSGKLRHNIMKISKRPRVIRDTNHRFTHINRLMVPEKEKDFVSDVVDLIKGSYWNSL